MQKGPCHVYRYLHPMPLKLRIRYRLLVWTLKFTTFVIKRLGFSGHIIADAEGDSGYHKLGAHKTFG